MPLSLARAKSAFLTQWTLLLGALLVLGLALGFSLRQDFQRTLAGEEERLLTQAAIVEQIVAKDLVSLNSVLHKLGAGGQAPRPGQEINARLKALEEGMPGVRTLAVLDPAGAIVASSRPEILGGDYSGRDYFQAARDAEDPDTLNLAPPFVTALGVRTINATRALRRPNGEFLGVVSATLDPAYFVPLLDSVLYAPDMWAQLVHYDGEIFLDMPRREGLAGTNLMRPETLFYRHRQSGRAVNVFSARTWSTGEQRILVARNIQPQGLRLDKPLVVGLARDPRAVLARWRADLALQGGLYLAFGALSCAGLWLHQRRQRHFDLEAAKASQALRDSERFMRTIADNIPGMVGYWDAELRCRFANSAYLEWFGRSPADMSGITIMELLGRELFAKNEQFIRAALRGEPQHFERTLTRADGSVGYTLAHYIPDVVDGEVRGFFVLVADVTELKRSQLLLEDRVAQRTEELSRMVEALRAAKAQAEAASRTKSAFLANLSHELRTPLNPIVALSELMLSGELTAEQREYMAEIQGASQRLLALFNRFFELLALEDHVPEADAVSLAGFRQVLLNELEPLARQKGLALEGGVDPGLPQLVWLDLRLLRMAAQELGQNAVRFTESGRVGVDFTLRPASAPVGAPATLGATGEDRLCLEITDTGRGIPAERIEAIRGGLAQAEEPLTRRYGGLGLGMAKVVRAIELLGGVLEIESGAGSGTTMRVLLPLRPVPADQAEDMEYSCTPEGKCRWTRR